MWLSRLSTRVSVAPRHQLRYAGLHSTRTLQYLTQTSIESLAISDRSKRVLTQEMNYEFLTHVQNETMPHILAGKDVLAKGKTGNGKTIAFLLPTIENLLKARESSNGSRDSGAKISTLVISPTRELASQIAVEAEKLTAAHGMRTACLVGGTSMNSDVKQLSHARGVDVLVATPGRLQAHLDDNSGNIRQKLRDLRVLVLDEADRLLDMGFRREIMKIIESLPTERQTLLFSATLPASTDELKDVALRADYEFVDTIHEDDHQTNVQTVQEYVTCPLPDVIATVESVLTEHMQQHESSAYKVLVFLPTARAAQFMAQLFVKAKFPNVLEMHSRKSQSARTKAADAFRSGKNVIMFSSDVSARGVDYPDVSLVLQVGLTDRDQYIHRLGRTARAGMEGRGVLVLADFETPFLKDLADLPLVEKVVARTPSSSAIGLRTTAALARGLKPESELEKSATQAYQAFLGFYNGNQKKLGLDKEGLVAIAEHYSHAIGLSETPRLDKRILRKMGLFGVAGLEPAAHAERQFAVKSSSGGSRGGRSSSDRSDRIDRRADHRSRDRSDRRTEHRSRDRSDRSFDRGDRRSDRFSSERRSTPRNFGESDATPESERFDLRELAPPVRYERAPRSSSEPPVPSSRERSSRTEQFGRGDRERRSDRDHERRSSGDRERRSDRDGERRTQQFGGGRDDAPRGRSTSRFDRDSSRSDRFSDRDARRSSGRSDNDRRTPRDSDRDAGERSDWRAAKLESSETYSASPQRERFSARDNRGRGRDSNRSRSEERPYATSHRRNRGEQRARERSDRFSKRS